MQIGILSKKIGENNGNKGMLLHILKKSEGMPRMMQTNSCKGTVYVVKEKDSLYKIAKAHGVRVKDIMRQNPFVNVYNLQIGDELCVPGFTNVIEGAFIPYVVKKGETILDIAKMHKITVENLAKSNKKIRELTLPVGTVLLIDKAK